MKSTSKRGGNIDPMAEARKGKYFKKYSLEAEIKIKLGIQIYKKREEMGMTQEELAKKAETTQKVISRIENGDVNVGFCLLNRIGSVLGFNCADWGRVLNFSVPVTKRVCLVSRNTGSSLGQSSIKDYSFTSSSRNSN